MFDQLSACLVFRSDFSMVVMAFFFWGGGGKSHDNLERRHSKNTNNILLYISAGEPLPLLQRMLCDE